MKRTIIQAIIFSLLIHGLFLGGQLAVGMSLSYFYVPSPDHAYDSVKYISQETSFGQPISGALGYINFLPIVTFLAGMAIFIIGKSVIIRIRKKNA